jgi:hypothetical protein
MLDARHGALLHDTGAHATLPGGARRAPHIDTQLGLP